MIITTPKCAWCNKSDKMITKKINFKHKDKSHYVIVWICERCNANNGVHLFG